MALRRAMRTLSAAKNAANKARASNAAERSKIREKQNVLAQELAAGKAKEAEEAAAKLQELQHGSNDARSHGECSDGKCSNGECSNGACSHDDSSRVDPENDAGGLPKLVLDPTLPDVLEDYFDMLQKLPASHGVDNVPSEEAFRAFWKHTHECIVKNTWVQRMLFGRAVWSVCFDQIFSYQGVKHRFEQKHFRVHDAMAYAAISSTGEMNMVSQRQFCAYHQNQFYLSLIHI